MLLLQLLLKSTVRQSANKRMNERVSNRAIFMPAGKAPHFLSLSLAHSLIFFFFFQRPPDLGSRKMPLTYRRTRQALLCHYSIGGRSRHGRDTYTNHPPPHPHPHPHPQLQKSTPVPFRHAWRLHTNHRILTIHYITRLTQGCLNGVAVRPRAPGLYTRQSQF